MTALLDVNLDTSYNWNTWKGDYSIVLPFLRDAFGRAVETFALSVPDELKTDLKIMVRQLCDPDPESCGHPLEKIGHHNQFSLQRYISTLNYLASRAEYGLLRCKA
jgi:hypothetical protein